MLRFGGREEKKSADRVCVCVRTGNCVSSVVEIGNTFFFAFLSFCSTLKRGGDEREGEEKAVKGRGGMTV